jgi:hypothetical protein
VKAETKTAIRFLALVSFLAFSQLALGGALMSVVVLAVSLFQSGKRAEYTRWLSLAPLVVMAAAGILRVIRIWAVVAWRLVRQRYAKDAPQP